MAKKTREIEIEYPDCTVCGSEISPGEEYFELEIKLYNQTLGKMGLGTGIRAGNSRPILVCSKCSAGLPPYGTSGNAENLKNKIIGQIKLQLETQMDYLYANQ